jgi:hypothetical protein
MHIRGTVAQLRGMGIKVFCKDGHIKVTLPWPVDDIPDLALEILKELHDRQYEARLYLLGKRD